MHRMGHAVLRLWQVAEDAHSGRITASQQARAAGGAIGSRGVKIREPHALFGQLIDIRRFRLATKTTEVRITSIVGQHNDDIWVLRENRVYGQCKRKGQRKDSHRAV